MERRRLAARTVLRWCCALAAEEFPESEWNARIEALCRQRIESYFPTLIARIQELEAQRLEMERLEAPVEHELREVESWEAVQRDVDLRPPRISARQHGSQVLEETLRLRIEVLSELSRLAKAEVNRG